MFKINFKAFDDFDELKVLTAEEFDREYRGIEGIIELDFDGNKYGFYFDDCPYGNERIFRWFEDLLTILIKIEESDYIAYKIPETINFWFEFVSKDNKLVVSLVEDIERDSIIDLFIKKPHTEFKYSDWNHVEISKQEFKHEIINQAHKLIHFIEVLNPQLLKSNSVQKLVELIKKAMSL